MKKFFVILEDDIYYVLDSRSYPNESYCYTTDDNGEDEPITATTLAFEAYDQAGQLICEDEGGCGLWL